MKRFSIITIFLISLSFTTIAHSESSIEKLIKSSGISAQNLGIYIVDSDKVIFENQSHVLLDEWQNNLSLRVAETAIVF